MERLLGVPEIRERYRCNDRTARKYMREMGALDVRPMLVPESAVEVWEARKRDRTEEPKEIRRRKMAEKQMRQIFQIVPVPPKPGQLISRERPKSLAK